MSCYDSWGVSCCVREVRWCGRLFQLLDLFGGLLVRPLVVVVVAMVPVIAQASALSSRCGIRLFFVCRWFVWRQKLNILCYKASACNAACNMERQATHEWRYTRHKTQLKTWFADGGVEWHWIYYMFSIGWEKV